MSNPPFSKQLFRYRLVLGLFILGLVMSGVTAFPLEWELKQLAMFLKIPPDADPSSLSGLQAWIALVRDGLQDTYAKYPWLAYGTDWLAFGHIIIALFFIGPWLDPVRNLWVLKIGIVACLLVLPLALICGPHSGYSVLLAISRLFLWARRNTAAHLLHPAYTQHAVII